MAAFLRYGQLLDLAAAPAALRSATLPLEVHPPLRPSVLAALARLGDVGSEVATYRDSTSRASKQAALLRATDALKDLGEQVGEQVAPPERSILRRIIQQWQDLIIEEGGAVGQTAVSGPVANPYILNNPVQGERFVGREDAMRRLEELWGPDGQVPSVILFGHRRMGKSSILRNIGARFGARTIVVDFNMQRIGRVESNAMLLCYLAIEISDACGLHGVRGLAEPQEQDFPPGREQMAFTRFLRRLDQVREGRRFIIAVDEFEYIERQMDEERLTPDLLDFWRGSFMTFPWFVMAFAGLHTLNEMRHDYWHPLFGSVTAIQVSFLSEGAARRLITQPTNDFDVDYDEAALRAIIALTSGQPFLLNLIGHSLVTRFNQQTYEEGKERERCFRLADVEAVINAPEFSRDGDAYFGGVWRQAEQCEPPDQTAVLRALAPHEEGLPLPALARAAGVSEAQAGAALDTLRCHDVVTQRDGRSVFTVELMRRWVEQEK